YLIKTNGNGGQTWAKTLGGSDFVSGSSTQQTDDGGYIVTGNIQYFGTSNNDVYLTKTDGNGNQIWTKTFGGSGTDVGNCVQLTVDGGFIIVGVTDSFGAGGNDVYLIKTNPNGNKK
ncbi:MAG: hypothetical protein KGZ58_02370, partial [Ignavibacteriales bacterium]|nr:hypothetical protein [Ignavibacteriales bacterium]